MFGYENKVITELIESFYDGILIADKDAFVRFVNEAYLNIASIKREDIINKSLREVRPGSILPMVIRTGNGRKNLFRREGDTDYIVNLSPIISDGVIIGGLSLVKDIMQTQELSNELERYIKKNKILKASVISLSQAKYKFEDAIGVSREFQDIVKLAKKIAEYDEDTLILGESGTGKELFAEAIHNASVRANEPFVAINCSTLTPALMESELFGYTSGSFTGAVKGGKTGLFSIAEKGTILLDEIGDLPYEMQAKLLRVLQERKIRRIGEHKEEDIDVRIIAATNKNLHTLVQENLFRSDLYYRLSVMTIELPNLRSRPDDLMPLAKHFLQKWNTRRKRHVEISNEVYKSMEKYPWPGNVRELKNVIQFSAYTCADELITELTLPKSVTNTVNGQNIFKTEDFSDMSLKKIMESYEKQVIKAMIAQYTDTLTGKKEIAKRMDISLASLYNKIKQYNL